MQGDTCREEDVQGHMCRGYGLPGDTSREEDVSVNLDEVGSMSWPHALSVIQNEY